MLLFPKGRFRAKNKVHIILKWSEQYKASHSLPWCGFGSDLLNPVMQGLSTWSQPHAVSSLPFQTACVTAVVAPSLWPKGLTSWQGGFVHAQVSCAAFVLLCRMWPRRLEGVNGSSAVSQSSAQFTRCYPSLFLSLSLNSFSLLSSLQAAPGASCLSAA